MNTIAKIGKAALVRLFSSTDFRVAGTDTNISFEFPSEDFDLHALQRNGYINEHVLGSIQYIGGVSFHVWGIRLGLVTFEVRDGETVAESLERTMEERAFYCPSHLIVSRWSSDDLNGNEARYTIYRLSQEQEKNLKELLTPEVSMV